MPERRFVYILRSDSNPARHYVGLTSDVPKRLRWHNAGQNLHTVRDRPWSIVVSLEFCRRAGRVPIRTLPQVRFRPRVREAAFLSE
jgi:predicted GIY-YIG superfamily endonuclease